MQDLLNHMQVITSDDAAKSNFLYVQYPFEYILSKAFKVF